MILSSARADVIVIANRSRRDVRFEIVDGERSASIAPQRVLTLYVEQPIRIRLAAPKGKQSEELRLDVDSAYFFHDGKNQDVELTRIGLGEAPVEPAIEPPNEARPHEPAGASKKLRAAEAIVPIITIPVKLLVDDEERAVRRLWEDRLRKRLAAASEVFERQLRVRFEVAAVDTWKTDDELSDFDESRREFQQLVEPRPGRLAIGFASQYQIAEGSLHLGQVQPPLVSHLLIPESSPQIPEPGRRELLVHELGHYLGAVHSPEAGSAMRPVLGDRKMAAPGYLIGIDPVNSLAIGLVAEQVRLREVTSLAEIDLSKRQRLSQLYMTMWQVLPDDLLAAEYLALVERPPAASEPPPETDRPKGEAPPPKLRATVEVRLDAFVAATQAVIRAIVVAAGRNARLADAAGRRAAPTLSGDELTNLYVRSAAEAALKLPADQRGPAFFLGLALGLDRSDRIRKYAILGELIQRIEPDADRQRRLAVLGRPTYSGREDLLQHFMFSAAITAMAGPASAESAGLTKELTDSRGQSGFSFVDWCADLSGIALTKRVQTGEVPLSLLASHFRTTDYLPDVAGLAEGLTRDEFTRRYGSTNDERFRRLDDDIRRRIARLYQSRN